MVSKPKGRNVMLLLSGLNEFYSGRVQKYLQPEPVGGNFYADSDEAFEEITSRPQSEWHLLLTDQARANKSAVAIEQFRTRHPNCTVAVMRRTGSGYVPGPGVIVVDEAPEIDDWLAMMYGLLA